MLCLAEVVSLAACAMYDRGRCGPGFLADAARGAGCVGAHAAPVVSGFDVSHVCPIANLAAARPNGQYV